MACCCLVNSETCLRVYEHVCENMASSLTMAGTLGGGGSNLFHRGVDSHPQRHVLKSYQFLVKYWPFYGAGKTRGQTGFTVFHHKFLQKAECSSYVFGSWTCWSIQQSTHTLQQDGLEAQMGCSCVPRIVLINMVVLLVHHTAGQHQESFAQHTTVHVLSLLIFCCQKLESEARVELTAMTESSCWLQDSFQFFVLMCKSRYHSPPVVDDWLCANKASLWTIL